jgi:hypothetical protein
MNTPITALLAAASLFQTTLSSRPTIVRLDPSYGGINYSIRLAPGWARYSDRKIPFDMIYPTYFAVYEPKKHIWSSAMGIIVVKMPYGQAQSMLRSCLSINHKFRSVYAPISYQGMSGFLAVHSASFMPCPPKRTTAYLIWYGHGVFEDVMAKYSNPIVSQKQTAEFLAMAETIKPMPPPYVHGW